MKIVEVTNKVVRTSDPIPKLSKPVTGREQKHPYTGMLVGSKYNVAEEPKGGMYIPNNTNPVYIKMKAFLEFALTQGYTSIQSIIKDEVFDSLAARLAQSGIDLTEALTEAEFDEAAGEKDACYHKVKSRYKVWPSAYASGALVKCRKVGAKNWGNSKKKKKKKSKKK